METTTLLSYYAVLETGFKPFLFYIKSYIKEKNIYFSGLF